MKLDSAILIVYAASTWHLVGTVWFGQMLHFPLFREVGPESFPHYIDAHYRAFGPVLWPAIATNLLALVAMLVGLRPPAVSGSLLIAAWR